MSTEAEWLCINTSWLNSGHLGAEVERLWIEAGWLYVGAGYLCLRIEVERLSIKGGHLSVEAGWKLTSSGDGS